MVNTLSKDAAYYLFYPEPIYQYNPAYSYKTTRYTIPGSPVISGTLKYTVNPKKIKQPGTNELITFVGDDPTETLTFVGTLPSPAGIGSVPKTVIINVPASYSIYYPEPYIKEHYFVGWNGSAVSKDSFINFGEAEFSIDTSTVGSMVGLTTSNDAAKNSGYALIRYAFYCALGKYSVYVNGLPTLIQNIPFVSSDIFKIIIGISGVNFLVNNIEVYSILITPELSTYVLKSSLYVSQDKVLNASIRQVSYANINSIPITPKQYIIFNGINYEVVNRKVLINNAWFNVISSGFVYIAGNLYIVQNNKIFYEGKYVSVVDGTVTVIGVNGASYPIDYSSIVIINNKVYSVFTKVNRVPAWWVGLESKLVSKDYSFLNLSFEIDCRLEPFYGLYSEANINTNLIYKDGSYLQNDLVIDCYIEPYYGLSCNLIIDCLLYYKNFSSITASLDVYCSLTGLSLLPIIPPTLTVGFEVGCRIRDYIIENPSLTIIV